MINSIDQLLKDYGDIPDFFGIEIKSVNARSQYGDQVLHMACVKGSVKDAELILAHGADINARGESGYTPLHYAVEQGHIKLVTWLLQKKARQDISDENGQTPFDLADLLGNEEMKRILLGEEKGS